jgi:hypothetical protein
MIDPSYFERKRAELGMDRSDALGSIQEKLDQLYPGQVRAKQLHKGVLRLVTPNASVASELRMRQVELEQIFNISDTRIAISIGSLS